MGTSHEVVAFLNEIFIEGVFYVSSVLNKTMELKVETVKQTKQNSNFLSSQGFIFTSFLAGLQMGWARREFLFVS